MKGYSILISILLVIAILITTLSIFPYAQPEAYSLSPQAVQTIKANPGSTVKFTGNDDPSSDVTILITTSTQVDVKKGRYSISLSNVYIPGSSNSFSIAASPVQTMTVAGNSRSYNGISAVKAVAISDGRGSFSYSNVPSDRYNIMVYGQASGSTVNIDASASCVVYTDKKGKYSGSVDTSGMPKGVYNIYQNSQQIAIVKLGV